MAKGFKYNTDDTTKWKPWKCAVCDSCFLNIRSGRCVAGGPFKGYIVVDAEGREIRAVERESPDCSGLAGKAREGTTGSSEEGF